MNNIRKPILAVVSALMFASVSHAAIISQISASSIGNSGTGNYGQGITVSSSLLSENVLTEFSTEKGNLVSGTTTGYIDVYSLGTANIDDLNFGTLVEVGNLDYLGSSTNVIDTLNTSDGGTLQWTFANITLPFDTPIFLVFSDTNTAGTFLGTSTKVQGNSGLQNYVNITAADSYTLGFGGDVQLARADPVDNQYSVTLVPEPASLALAGLGAFCIVAARRRFRHR